MNSRPRLAGRRQQLRNVAMRADANTRRRVGFADVREQKQHQQRPAARRHVDAPLAICALETRIDVPTRHRPDRRRSGSGSETCRGCRAAASDPRRRDRRTRRATAVYSPQAETVLGIVAETDDRTRPRRRIVADRNRCRPTDTRALHRPTRAEMPRRCARIRPRRTAGPARHRANAQAHQLLRNSRSRTNTSCCDGFFGRSGNASRNRSITLLLVRRKNVLICFSSPNEVTRGRSGSWSFLMSSSNARLSRCQVRGPCVKPRLFAM